MLDPGHNDGCTCSLNALTRERTVEDKVADLQLSVRQVGRVPARYRSDERSRSGGLPDHSPQARRAGQNAFAHGTGPTRDRAQASGRRIA